MTMTQSRPQATSKRLLETDRTIVTEWRFAPGAETGWHRHAHDYVVVVLTAGKLMQETENGEIVTELAAGQTYARNVGVEHNVVSPNPHESFSYDGRHRPQSPTRGSQPSGRVSKAVISRFTMSYARAKPCAAAHRRAK